MRKIKFDASYGKINRSLSIEPVAGQFVVFELTEQRKTTDGSVVELKTQTRIMSANKLRKIASLLIGVAQTFDDNREDERPPEDANEITPSFPQLNGVDVSCVITDEPTGATVQ